MSLEEQLKKKLEGGKFRLINEKMYKGIPLEDKEKKEYHSFYRSQVSKWPENPKNLIIQKLEELKSENLKIADLGCGDAEISQKFKNVVSFDKYPINKEVIGCELTEIKADSGDFDIAICCLSLMMKYITKVLKEVNRILKDDGKFYLSEVTSRIRNTKKFISDIEKFGFKLEEVNKKNTHFSSFVFKKITEINPETKIPTVTLEPCSYKKR